jgi:hypothetical protein
MSGDLLGMFKYAEWAVDESFRIAAYMVILKQTGILNFSACLETDDITKPVRYAVEIGLPLELVSIPYHILVHSLA